MPPKPDKFERLESLTRKYRIEFCGEVATDRWPEHLQVILADIKQLGERKFSRDVDESKASETDPWKQERRAHAMHIVERAKRFRGSNESTWRHATESFITQRLDSEVCCPICRRRKWRSQIEVTPTGNSRASESLRQRQRSRQKCLCPRLSRSSDSFETVGMNKIFNFRTESEVHHDPEITVDLGKGEKPDRVYGLRKTLNIDILWYDLETQREIAEVDDLELDFLQQPMRSRGEAQLFPFLVLEAKKGASDDWRAIELQTAFSMRTLLETQRRLFTAAAELAEGDGKPLVWFFSNKGEDWRLSVGYTCDARPASRYIGTTIYRIIDVWRGCIGTRDAALQLLLLIDYIFDWARDIYREHVLQALRSVANGSVHDANLTYSDTDILSTRPLDLTTEILGISEDDAYAEFRAGQQHWTGLDSPQGVVRHASFVESQFLCIYITADNISTMMNHLAQTQTRRIASITLGLMGSPFLVDHRAILEIEQAWTETCRISPTSSALRLDEQFYIGIRLTTYLSADWHMIRELSVIAIQRSAWTMVAEIAGEGETSAASHERDDLFDTADILQVVRSLRSESPQDVIFTVIRRTSLKVVKANDLVSLTLTVVNDNNGSFRGLVNYIYTSVKRGVVEPTEDFIRVSTKFDRLGNPLENPPNTATRPFPTTTSERLQLSGDGCVLIMATCEPSDEPSEDLTREQSRICAYFTDPRMMKPSKSQLARIVRIAFETCDVYHTLRDPPRLSLASISQRRSDHVIWNIPRTYGVYSLDFAFLDLLGQLGHEDQPIERPVTQGSPRSEDYSGRRLYKRNFAPWMDWRVRKEYPDPERKFILQKLFTREANYWRTCAQKRASEGVACCPCCARIGSAEVCSACFAFIAEERQYDWYRAAVVGQDPPPSKTLTHEGIKGRFRTAMTHESLITWQAKSQTVSAPKRKAPPTPFDGRSVEDCNVLWSIELEAYAPLHEPFDDIDELCRQWEKFKAFCVEHRGQAGNLKRRKRADHS